MQTPVEMNQVPFSFTEPFFDLGHSLGGGPSIGRYSVQVHFSFKQGSGGQGVPDTDRVSDDQDMGQAFTSSIGAIGLTRFAFFVWALVNVIQS